MSPKVELPQETVFLLTARFAVLLSAVAVIFSIAALIVACVKH